MLKCKYMHLPLRTKHLGLWFCWGLLVVGWSFHIRIALLWIPLSVRMLQLMLEARNLTVITDEFEIKYQNR